MHFSHTKSGIDVYHHDRVVARISLPEVCGTLPKLTLSDLSDGWQRVVMAWDLPEATSQDVLEVDFCLMFEPDFWWAPHLAPEEGDVMAQHIFRSPALIASRDGLTFVLVPDLDLCGRVPETPWFMDVDAPHNLMRLGMSRTTIKRHVGYQREPGMVLPAGKVEFGFDISVHQEPEAINNPWRRVSRFLWDRYGHALYRSGEPLTNALDGYVEHVYNWAFKQWKNAVWQEFDMDDTRVGAAAFIVNVTQSPNYPGVPNLREFLSIWNQAWFSSLRSASGVMRYGKRTGDALLIEKALLTKAFALSAPVRDGIFPSVFRTHMALTVEGKKEVSSSLGWETGYWTNSDRTPLEQGITDAWFHILDASWTALLMLRWYDELEVDVRLLDYATVYAEKLLSLQDQLGFFPAWLHPETLEPSSILSDSPETSLSVTFLLKLAKLTGEKTYQDAALRAMNAVIQAIVSDGRWEDFETYWSCCSFGKESHLGKRFPRNAMYKQCNFSMFWTAEALLACHRATGESSYLEYGVRTLDELSMTQQTWQPPFIYIPALGGFGVMNYDGEWNDSRECLFAELFMDYYVITGDTRYFERGIAALKSSFVMMYCPENPKAKVLWEKVWPFFGPEDYGFTMENYGHSGCTDAEGEGIGEFTIFDWGNGAAAEARNRIRDHYGDVYVDRKRHHVFSIDNMLIHCSEQGFTLDAPVDTRCPRDILVVYDDGSRKCLHITAECRQFTL